MTFKSLYLGTALALSSLGVMAGELDAFVAAQDGATNCWYRAYDAQHLAAHPDQQVVAMDLTVSYMAETEMYPAQYVFRLEADLRDGRHGEAVGPCMADGDEMWCGVECDGGGIYVSQRSGGDVVADLSRNGYIAMTTSCGEDELEGFALEAGLDDHQFRLGAMPARFCLPAEY